MHNKMDLRKQHHVWVVELPTITIGGVSVDKTLYRSGVTSDLKRRLYGRQSTLQWTRVIHVESYPTRAAALEAERGLHDLASTLDERHNVLGISLLRTDRIHAYVMRLQGVPADSCAQSVSLPSNMVMGWERPAEQSQEQPVESPQEQLHESTPPRISCARPVPAAPMKAHVRVIAQRELVPRRLVFDSDSENSLDDSQSITSLEQ